MRAKLKNAREAKGMMQAALAKHLGISTRAYQNLEYGMTLGSIKHWDKLEDLFGIPQRELRVIASPNEIVE